MRHFIIAAASAIFFAAVIVELSSRLWPGSYVALLVIATLGLFFNGLLNRKLAAGAQTAAPTRKKSERTRDRGDERGRSRAKAEPRRQPRSGARPEPEAKPTGNGGPREDGEVKWFNRNKGFGFIIRESGEEIFGHQRSIRLVGEGENRRRPTLRDGQRVNFQVAERDKGIQAEDVVAID